MMPLLDVVYEIEQWHWLSSGHTADLPSAENLLLCAMTPLLAQYEP
jgi:hypothetical protein